MKKLPTVTIGIPAYNEEHNIGHLLKSLLEQKHSDFLISDIFVCLDNCSDDTESEVLKVRSRKIKVLKSRSRQGVAARQNQIINQTSSDVLVLMNADVSIRSTQFVHNLIKPILMDKVDITSANFIELSPRTFIESLLFVSMQFKKCMYQRYRHGNNVYTCAGYARAFSRELYSNFKFKTSVGEDAYSYLFAKFNNYRYQRVLAAKVQYRLPNNLSDHKKQSLRFLSSQKLFDEEFGEQFVNHEYKLPLSNLVFAFLKIFVHRPLLLSAYVVLFIYLKLLSFKEDYSVSTWVISTSSKVLEI